MLTFQVKKYAPIILLLDPSLYFKVTYNVELEVDIYCPMTFESYPIDSHICYFMLGSYSYDENVLNFTLNQLEFDVTNQVSLLDYFIKVRPLSKKYQRLKHGYGALQHKRTGSDGSSSICSSSIGFDASWSRLLLNPSLLTGCEIILERHLKKYIINYYIPSGLLVMVSWVN